MTSTAATRIVSPCCGESMSRPVPGQGLWSCDNCHAEVNPAPARVTPGHARGIPAATVSFRATLTATTNPYLADRLPLEGLVMIHERSVHGECQFVTFMPDAAYGDRTSFVQVPNAEFTFRTRL